MEWKAFPERGGLETIVLIHGLGGLPVDWNV